ncbi:MAG: hypothetical protein RLZZ189_2324 [Pseudomonadota bacterium]
MHTGLEAGGVGIEMDTYSPWCQASRGPNADDTGIAFDEGQFVQFSEIVHFSNHELSEPRCDNTTAVVVVHFGGVEQGL